MVVEFQALHDLVLHAKSRGAMLSPDDSDELLQWCKASQDLPYLEQVLEDLLPKHYAKATPSGNLRSLKSLRKKVLQKLRDHSALTS